MDTESDGSQQLKGCVKTADVYMFMEKDAGKLFGILPIYLFGQQDDRAKYAVSQGDADPVGETQRDPASQGMVFDPPQRKFILDREGASKLFPKMPVGHKEKCGQDNGAGTPDEKEWDGNLSGKGAVICGFDRMLPAGRRMVSY